MTFPAIGAAASEQLIRPGKGYARPLKHLHHPGVSAIDSLHGSIIFGRLVIRWEYHVENFFGMVRLGCMQILFGYL